MLQCVAHAGITGRDGTLRAVSVDLADERKKLLDDAALITALQDAVRIVLLQQRFGDFGIGEVEDVDCLVNDRERQQIAWVAVLLEVVEPDTRIPVLRRRPIQRGLRFHQPITLHQKRWDNMLVLSSLRLLLVIVHVRVVQELSDRGDGVHDGLLVAGRRGNKERHGGVKPSEHWCEPLDWGV